MTAPAAPGLRRSGGCLCGAVRFEAMLESAGFGACHCEMCRRWTGSALLALSVPAENVTWQGAAQIATRQSSAWAMRAWCSACGSPLYYRVTAEGPHAGTLEIPLGLLDDPGGLVFESEIYIDVKPDCFAYAGEGRRLMTRQECLDAFAIPESAPKGDSHDTA